MQDRIYKVSTKKTGNCGCFNCGQHQPGWKLQPYTVWYKLNGETRGHNCPVCSKECADKFIKNSLPTIKNISIDDLMN